MKAQTIAIVVFSLLIIGLIITISYAVINRRKIKKGVIK